MELRTSYELLLPTSSNNVDRGSIESDLGEPWELIRSRFIQSFITDRKECH